ncbi:unnamed protein product [Hymenolepis diminuta]|uniref:ANK_REP_REGION domain-containing protein n=2 Tax=Hymenolepis diminuta TaxID=6216 RepID=A0A158QFW9_HYMDI|nr:unnamed protein product [Hymenolepis diminuta]
MSDVSITDIEIHSSDEDEQEAVFNSSSFQAFIPQLDNWERRIIRSVFGDNVDSFISSCAEISMFIEKNILVNDIQYLSSYRAMKFPDLLNQVSIMHIVVLLSAHRILQYLLDVYPASKIWSTTKLERTALHYAAETNLESVVTLLSYDKQLLKSVDTDGLTPLQFIHDEQRPIMEQFLKLHTELLEKSGESDQGSGADTENVLLSNICGNCNIRSSNHESFSTNEEFTRVMTNRKYNFIRRPTNTFGQFEKAVSPVVSQYVRLAECTTIKKLETLLFDLWQMPKPGLVLSFYGTDPLSPSLQKLLQKSLGRITKQTRTWILTDGREKCVGDVVSKAVKTYAEAYGMKQLQVIGLVPWRRLYNSQVLRCSDYMGQEQMTFPKKPPENDTRIQLAENHTHYIFLDSRESHKDLPLCRTQFEAFVSHLTDRTYELPESYNNKEHHISKHEYRLDLGIPKRLNSPFQAFKGSTTNPIPVCGILIEGDRSNLLGISYALRQNIPFVVISDTGGLAKALGIFVKFMKQLLQSEVNEAFQLRWSNCKSNLRNLIERAKGVVELEPSDEKYLKEILERAYLLEFITSNYEGSTEMDARILQSLVKPELFEGIDEEESWNFKIRIALSLNRTDILPENMFSRVQWKDKKGMKELVTKCLMENNTDFIRLLVDSGFLLHESIDENLLGKLYKADFDSNDPRVQLFKNYVLTLTKIPQMFRWSQIGQIITSILGFEPGIHLTSSKLKARRPTSFDDLLTISDNRNEGNAGEESLLQLLIWSFICRRFDLSYLIWTLMKDSIPAALMLACFARKMRTQQQSQREVAELDKMAEFYERIAVGILEECHMTDSQSTLIMLCTMRPLYGNLSQLLLAEESQSMDFIEHQACQICIENMWNQNLSSNIQLIWYLISLVVGVILPPLVPFLAEYNYSKSRHPELQRYGHSNPNKVNEKNKIPFKSTYKSKFLDFYKAPCVRFAYSAYDSVLFVGLYFYFLLSTKSDTSITEAEIILDVAAVLLLIQHIVLSIESNKSAKQYFNSIWNRIVLLTLFFYIIGSLHYADPRVHGFDILVVLSRLFLSCCLLCACAFTLHFLVVSRYIGPKLMMIITIMRRDMLPYMAIICVFWLIFSLFTVAMILKPTGTISFEDQGNKILIIIRGYFFSMFGEFNIPDNVQSIGYTIDETQQRQIVNWQKLRSLDYLYRHPEAYSQMRAQVRSGKGGKKDWWIEPDVEEESQEAHIAETGAKLSTELIETRLVGLEMRLAVANFASANLSNQAPPKYALETPSISRDHDKTRIASLEEGGQVINRSQSKCFDPFNFEFDIFTTDTFHMSKLTNFEPEKLQFKQFTYDNHKVTYFNNPQDDITPHSLTRFIPWTEEFPNYEPKMLDNRERFSPDWTTEEMEEGNIKGRKSMVLLKNPTGRTGTAGRGLLPSFGPNSAVVVVFILVENLPKYESNSSEGEVLHRILLRSCPPRKHQLPWFICKHTADCDKLACMQSLFLSYMHSVIDEASKLDSNQTLIYRLIVEELDKCPIRLCHLGELEDWVNCDNAWIDITAICVRIAANFRFWDVIPQLFTTTSSKAEWFEVSKLPPVKSSHFSCLAYFLEVYLRNQAQIDV